MKGKPCDDYYCFILAWCMVIIIEIIEEKKDLWQHLKETTKPIYLYGMGDGALKIMSVLKRLDIPLFGIYASDEFVRGHSFEGHLVRKYSDVFSAHQGEFISLLAFGAGYEPLIGEIYEKSRLSEFYAPDVPVCYDGDIADIEVFNADYFNAHKVELELVYENLADELSKKTFINVINFKLSGKISYLKEIESPISEAYSLINPSNDAVYVDLGGFTGDTALEFLSYTKTAKRIIVFEPDKKNFSKLCANLKAVFHNAECLQYAAWSDDETLYFKGGKGGRNSRLSKEEVNCKTVLASSVDNYLKGEKADIIKFDVEGAEGEALLGCKNTIEKHHPKIMLSAYHKNDDLFALVKNILLISGTKKVYKIFLRHHPYFPSWETNFYIV